MDKKRDTRRFRDLEVYRRAFQAAMMIFQLTEDFPAEDRYSMVDQINSRENKAEKFCF